MLEISSCVISCPNKMSLAVTNITNIVFDHECYLYRLLMMNVEKEDNCSAGHSLYKSIIKK